MDDPFFANLAAALARRAGSRSEPWPAAWGGALAAQLGTTLRSAGVLVPLFRAPDGAVGAVFTLRARGLSSHAGQVSFPGGAAAVGDADLTATALREAHEEIGLDPASCRVLGQLDPLPVPSGFQMTPVVAKIPSGYPFVAAPAEVERIFTLPLAALLTPGALETVPREALGRTFEVLYYRVAGEVVWGATARILQQLLTLAAPLL